MFINTLRQAEERYDNYTNLAEIERLTVQTKFQALFQTLLPEYILVVHLVNYQVTVWRKDVIDFENNQVVFALYDDHIFLHKNCNFSQEETVRIMKTFNKILFGK